jgi:cell shape-determining protein MreD
MLAIIAAIVFGLGLLFDLLNVSPAGINATIFILLGLCLLALHQAGIGTASVRSGWRKRRS